MTKECPWSATPASYLAGQAEIDDLDRLAITMETKWGADRLRLLVDKAIRVKFDVQRQKTNEAIWRGELGDVIRECKRMANAWRALDQAAEANAKPLDLAVWEVSLQDGTVAAIVRDSSQAGLLAAQATAEGRALAVYTLEEVGRLLSRFAALTQVKAAFPGAQVTRIRQSVGDPLNSME